MTDLHTLAARVMTADEQARKIAAGLSEAQRRFILNASVKPKKWMTIRRHAKISNATRVHRLTYPLGLMEQRGGAYMTSLTPLGLAVRKVLHDA